MLCESAYCSAATRALLALLLFHASRLNARTDENGAVVLLEDQDRSQRDWRLIRIAQSWLARSKADQPTTFHLEAAIAMQHCVSESVETTDWGYIVRLYDRLLQLRHSPVYALNRAIALGQAGDTAEALCSLRAIRQREDMRKYFLLDCAIARMHELDGNRTEAINAYLDAMAQDVASHEKELLK